MFSGCGVPAFPNWFSITFLKIVVEVMTLGQPQVCKLWLGVIKGLLPVYIQLKHPHGSQLLWAPNSWKVGVVGTCLP